MKKVLIATIMVAMVAGLAMSCNAATDQSATTSASITVGSVFSIGFLTTVKPPAVPPRSSTSITFSAVGSPAPVGLNGWYYNSLATLNANGDPNDNNCDVGILCKSNAHTSTKPFYLKIKKSSDSLDNMIGYNVGGAWDAGASTSTELLPATGGGTVTYPSAFKGSTGTSKNGWGTLPTALTTIYTSGTNVYSTYGVLIPISFALVPDGLAASGTAYSTTITYTMTAPV